MMCNQKVESREEEQAVQTTNKCSIRQREREQPKEKKKRRTEARTNRTVQSTNKCLQERTTKRKKYRSL